MRDGARWIGPTVEITEVDADAGTLEAVADLHEVR